MKLLGNLLRAISALEIRLLGSYAQHPDVPMNGFTSIEEIEVETDQGPTLVAYAEGGANNGCRATFVFGPEGAEGWDFGFRLPVPLRPLAEDSRQAVIRALRQRGGAAVGKLLLAENVPGFVKSGSSWPDGSVVSPAEGTVFHRHGWFSRSAICRAINNLPAWLGCQAAVSLQEGVYLSWADGSCRLAPHKEFWNWLRRFPDAPVGRQGDCLVFGAAGLPFQARVYGGGGESHTLDRHSLVAPEGATIQRGDNHEEAWTCLFVAASSEGGVLRLEHPEHEAEEIRLDPYGECVVTLLPGRSRPFSRAYGSD